MSYSAPVHRTWASMTLASGKFSKFTTLILYTAATAPLPLSADWLCRLEEMFVTQIGLHSQREDHRVRGEPMLFDWLTWISLLMNTSCAMGKITLPLTQAYSSSISHIRALLSAAHFGNGGGRLPFCYRCCKILLRLERLRKSIKWRFYMYCRRADGNAGGCSMAV